MNDLVELGDPVAYLTHLNNECVGIAAVPLELADLPRNVVPLRLEVVDEPERFAPRLIEFEDPVHDGGQSRISFRQSVLYGARLSTKPTNV